MASSVSTRVQESISESIGVSKVIVEEVVIKLREGAYDLRVGSAEVFGTLLLTTQREYLGKVLIVLGIKSLNLFENRANKGLCRVDLLSLAELHVGEAWRGNHCEIRQDVVLKGFNYRI